MNDYIILLQLVFMCFILISSIAALIKSIHKRHYKMPITKYNNLEIANLIKQADPNFNRIKFEKFAKDLFVDFQNTLTNGNLEIIRPFETIEFFEKHNMELNKYVKNNQIIIKDKIIIKDINFVSFEHTVDKDILKIDIDSKMCEYIIDRKTKQVIAGNKNVEHHNTYTMTFVRKKGSLTKTNELGINATNCPNCGAPVHMISTGKCQYCNSIIVTNDCGWILSNLVKK